MKISKIWDSIKRTLVITAGVVATLLVPRADAQLYQFNGGPPPPTSAPPISRYNPTNFPQIVTNAQSTNFASLLVLPQNPANGVTVWMQCAVATNTLSQSNGTGSLTWFLDPVVPGTYGAAIATNGVNWHAWTNTITLNGNSNTVWGYIQLYSTNILGFAALGLSVTNGSTNLVLVGTPVVSWTQPYGVNQ